MKRTIALFALLALVLGSVAAQEVYPTLTPKNAKSMGLGGTFTAIPTAEFSFFGNPAVFAAKKGSLTLISTDTWAYVKPTQANVDTLMAVMNKEMDALSAIPSLMPGNGIGGGTSIGLGWAGKGLGLGMFLTTDEYADGDDIASSTLISDTQLNAVLGLGVPITLGGLRLSIGGDLRPFYRVRTEQPLADLVAAMDGTEDEILAAIAGIKAGFGLAMDLGATLELGSITLGLSVRDIAPSFPVWVGNAYDLMTSLEGGSLPSTEGSSETAVFYPNVTAGFAWKPRFVPGLFEPAFYAELQDPVSVIKEDASVYQLLHAGAEIKVLSLFTVRGGINEGWLSVGAGIKLLCLDVNAAIFTEELGALPGDNPRSGIALQAALRF
jgi:hypothetical protein